MHPAKRFAFKGGASALLVALGFGLTAGSAAAQTSTPPSFFANWNHDTGEIQNDSGRRDAIASFTVFVQGATSLQLFFDEVQLAGDVFAGTESILRITSHLDGAVQELNRYQVQQWRNQSAYFNGDSVQVDLVASPGTGTNRLVLDRVRAQEAPTIFESQCGPTDDRVSSNDPRACRLLPIGCSGWLINDCNRCMLTAGHCLGGVGTAQFNVPTSNPNGSLNHPSPDDQYPVDPASIQGTGSGIGNDWGYIGTFPNSNTGLAAADAQGMTYALQVPTNLPSNQNIRITGYGTDTGSDNQTQQTNAGAWILFNGNRLSYLADTTGGNSGSPVIWEEQGTAIGIHTHAGCNPPNSGNNGTALTNPGLQSALNNPEGVCQASIQALSALPERIPSGVATTFDLSIEGTVAPGSAMLNVRYDGGSFLQIPLVHGGGTLYQAELPPPTCGADPEFYISADLGDCGGPITLPPGAPVDFLTVAVGDSVIAQANDMEADQGWSLDPASDATSGNWFRGTPNGASTSPDFDQTPGSGTDCWLTGATGDVDGGRTFLVSPPLDTTAMSNPFISYWRWYSNAGSNQGDRLRVAISNDNGVTYTQVEQVGPEGNQVNGGWFNHTFRIADFVTPTNQVRLRINASDNGPDSTIEAGFDDFELFDVVCTATLADCNTNGIVDSDDIASGRSFDTNADGVPDECSVGTEYCFCASGPCGNDAPGAGCLHSEGQGGRIAASGSASVSADDLVLTSFDLPADKFGLTFMGGGQIQVPFGDSLQCVGAGGVGVFRFPLQNTGAGGTLSLGPGLSALSVQRFSPAGHITAGSTWNFQSWMRDPMGPCGSGFTTSSAISVTFAP